MPRNPTNTKGILALLQGIADEATDTLEKSGGKIITSCQVEIQGKYLTDKNGEVVVAIEATADPTKAASAAVEANAKGGARWFRKSGLDWDGTLSVRWVLRPARQTTKVHHNPHSRTEIIETDLSGADDVEIGGDVE